MTPTIKPVRRLVGLEDFIEFIKTPGLFKGFIESGLDQTYLLEDLPVLSGRNSGKTFDEILEVVEDIIINAGSCPEYHAQLRRHGTSRHNVSTLDIRNIQRLIDQANCRMNVSFLSRTF